MQKLVNLKSKNKSLPKYHAEPYWNEVGKRILERNGFNVIAGDDEPYYHYKRQKFLALLHTIDFQNKKVLEIGSGPGGNLYEISSKNPGELHGVDISEVMVCISQKFLSQKEVTIQKIDGQHIPYENQYFDLSFTSTVLQHITDEAVHKNLCKEICRVTDSDIYLFERIEKKIKGNDLNLGRPVVYYKALLEKFGFTLCEVKFLDIQASYFVSGIIRKLFNARGKKEGEPASKISKLLQKISLPLTSQLDKIIKSNRELGMLHFQRTQPSIID